MYRELYLCSMVVIFPIEWSITKPLSSDIILYNSIDIVQHHHTNNTPPFDPKSIHQHRYKKAALKWHPDRHSRKGEEQKKEAEHKFKEIGDAFGVLTDPDRKKMYDQGFDREEIEQKMEEKKQQEEYGRGGGRGHHHGGHGHGFGGGW